MALVDSSGCNSLYHWFSFWVFFRCILLGSHHELCTYIPLCRRVHECKYRAKTLEKRREESSQGRGEACRAVRTLYCWIRQQVRQCNQPSKQQSPIAITIEAACYRARVFLDRTPWMSGFHAGRRAVQRSSPGEKCSDRRASANADLQSRCFSQRFFESVAGDRGARGRMSERAWQPEARQRFSAGTARGRSGHMMYSLDALGCLF